MLVHGCARRSALLPAARTLAAYSRKAPIFTTNTRLENWRSSFFFAVNRRTGGPPRSRCLSLMVRGYSQSRYEQFRQWQQQQQQQQQRDESEWDYRPEDPNGGRVLLMRPTLWALAFTAGTFYVCSNAFAGHKERVAARSRSVLDILWPAAGVDEEEDRVWALMSDPSVQRLVGRTYRALSESHAKMIRRVARLPEWVPNELKRTIVALSDKWYQLSRGTQCVYAIVGLNAVVFGMWQVPRLLPFMIRRFLHDPRSGLSYTMLTSTFSHREIWHFMFNSIALVSFGSSVADVMGAEHFTAFYLSAGVWSSLASHLLAPLRPALILPSLGASGAVYGVVGATMMMFPRAQIALIFLPFIPMTISQAFPALLAYDFVGAVLGWKTFNHIAHLGGGLYGIAYTEWGIEYWNKLVREIRRRRQEKS